jgi:hypothetical protein
MSVLVPLLAVPPAPPLIAAGVPAVPVLLGAAVEPEEPAAPLLGAAGVPAAPLGLFAAAVPAAAPLAGDPAAAALAGEPATAPVVLFEPAGAPVAVAAGDVIEGEAGASGAASAPHPQTLTNMARTLQ